MSGSRRGFYYANPLTVTVVRHGMGADRFLSVIAT
jgi:hypothetical protein